MTRPNVNRRFALLVSFALLAWLGLFVNNTADPPALTLVSPENSVPALVSAILVIAWWLLPWKRSATVALLGWGLLHFICGILSVLPLGIWPYEPAQSLSHYAMHLLYALAQLPLIWLLVSWIRSPHTAMSRSQPAYEEVE
jgi:hypothetical protein